MSFLTLSHLSKFYGTQCVVDDLSLSGRWWPALPRSVAAR